MKGETLHEIVEFPSTPDAEYRIKKAEDFPVVPRAKIKWFDGRERRVDKESGTMIVGGYCRWFFDQSDPGDESDQDEADTPIVRGGDDE